MGETRSSLKETLAARDEKYTCVLLRAFGAQWLHVQYVFTSSFDWFRGSFMFVIVEADV